MRIAAILTTSALTLLAGCNSNSMVGSHTTQSRPYFGKLRVNGNLHNITVENSSRLYRLSVFGDANFINFEDDVTCNKIEIFGENNRISIPDALIIRVNEVGQGNLIERRPKVEGGNTRLRAARVTTTYSSTYPRDSYSTTTSTTYEATPAPAQPVGSGMTTYYSTPEGYSTTPPASTAPAPTRRPATEQRPIEPAPQPAPSPTTDDAEMIEMSPA